ncbi:hypothetical protein QVA66_01330 [Staphylococcus chromogenes]|nr:hypothetical protein [Staphylococcus chromogenes]
MILCVTPAPALDRTAHADGDQRGVDTHQLRDIFVVPAGGGTNVAHLLSLAGQETMTVVPAPRISQYMRMVGMLGLPCDVVEVAGPIPVHFKVSFPNGAHLEFRDPPMPLDAAQLAILREHAVSHAERATWMVLAGELPAVANTGWFVDVMRATQLYHPHTKIAVATAGPALSAVLRQVFTTKPHVIALDKGNVDIDLSTEEIVATLVDAGVDHILLCEDRRHFQLYSSGTQMSAEFVADESDGRLPWIDAALAGLLLADPYQDPAAALRYALAYANSAGGTESGHVPTPDSLALAQVKMQS